MEVLQAKYLEPYVFLIGYEVSNRIWIGRKCFKFSFDHSHLSYFMSNISMSPV